MVMLTIGTVFTVLYLVLTILGRKYSYMTETLSGDAFPFSFIYIAGFAAQRFFKPNGRFTRKMREYNIIYYGKQNGEFYTRVAWAQVISFTLLLAAVSCLLSTIIKDLSAIILMMGLGLIVYLDYSFLNYAKGKVDKRQDDCDYELPNAISKLALLVNSGVILREAWRLTAYGKEGVLYDMMRYAWDRMENGTPDYAAIRDFGVMSNSSDIKKLTTALLQSMERGGGELSYFLANQSSELWSRRRQLSLQRGERAAGALLAPIAIMFMGVMLIVLTAALQNMGL